MLFIHFSKQPQFWIIKKKKSKKLKSYFSLIKSAMYINVYKPSKKLFFNDYNENNNVKL